MQVALVTPTYTTLSVKCKKYPIPYGDSILPVWAQIYWVSHFTSLLCIGVWHTWSVQYKGKSGLPIEKCDLAFFSFPTNKMMSF